MKSDVFCRLCNKLPSALKNVKLSSDFESILLEIGTHTTSSATVAAAKDDLVVNVIKNHPLRVLQAGVAGYLILSIVLFRSSRNTDTHRNSWSKNVFIAGTAFYLIDLLCNISLPNQIDDLGQQQNIIYQQISSLLSHVSSDNIHFLLLTQFMALSDSSLLSPLLSLGPYLVLYLHTILSIVFPTFTRTAQIGKKTKGNIRRFDFQMVIGLLSVVCNFLNTVLQCIVVNLSWITKKQSITQLSSYSLAVEATKVLLIMNFSVMKIFSLSYGLWKKNKSDAPSIGGENKNVKKKATLEKEPAKKKKKTRKAKTKNEIK
jgi:hypothetical protein